MALRYNLPVVGGLVLIFVRASSLPVRHTIWGQVSTAAIGLALGVHWLATVLSVAPWLLTATNLAALTTMLLALLGIARRAPLPRVARLP